MKNVLLFALMLSGVAGSSAAEVATKYACPAKLSPEHMVKRCPQVGAADAPENAP